ncbi:hypothetical protein BDY21DRAFT_344246 [Lineolata rhizophorae]|uniref:Uncharacterized protein n=1 Tax=Lineolata rhizophorae TaxID=578093 RepID=A0A6A6P177_9PEZI|nr:hypothetical protein BDY21DRAFT_344246 [Lineolata rhizophorae]
MGSKHASPPQEASSRPDSLPAAAISIPLSRALPKTSHPSLHALRTSLYVPRRAHARVSAPTRQAVPGRLLRSSPPLRRERFEARPMCVHTTSLAYAAQPRLRPSSRGRRLVRPLQTRPLARLHTRPALWSAGT